MKPGTYALLLRLDRPQTIRVGALGQVEFPTGWYLYVGSARGPGGLEARLARHRRRSDKRFHWHIDYLRARASLVEAWTHVGSTRRECAWAQAAAALPAASLPVRHFGSSDCGCPTHLVYCPTRPDLREFERLTGVSLHRTQVSEWPWTT